MRRPFSRFARTSAAALAALVILSCTDNATGPRLVTAPDAAQRDLLPGHPTLIISQVYGGGGNSGATYTNDFVEIFNPGDAPVSVSGWSVQYTSSSGTSWAATPLSGSIPAGGYYLVQEAVGAGGTTPLPTPDAIGTLAMSATAGKVLLASQATPFSGACPTGATVVDTVGFGSTNCGAPNNTATLSNTTAAVRKNAGCTWTGKASVDFDVAAPTPRNSASPKNPCSVPSNPVATVTITPDSTGVLVGSTTSFVAAGLDASNSPTATTFTWTTSDPLIATVNASGIATGVAAGSVTITATSANNVVATAKLTVTAPGGVTNHAGDIVISQVFGGGGNAGATLKNDFVELFNRSTQDIDVTGWSVQYASAGGAFTQLTALTGVIPAGGYYLVGEGAGTGGTVDLPTPDVAGSLNMGAAAGKILLIQSAQAAGVACPTGLAVVDQVSYGTGTNCGTTTATLSATLGAMRKSGGCMYTADVATDFTTAAPAPRNSATTHRSCVVGPLDHVTINGSLTVLAGASTQLTATAFDANENLVTGGSTSWSTGNASLATVSATGLVSGVMASSEPVVITATVIAGGVTKTASVNITVNTEGINWVDISSSSTSFPAGFQTQLFPTARVQQGGTIIPATFTFEAVDPQYATVQTVQNTGIITGVSAPADGSKPGVKVTATPIGGGATYTFIAHPVTIEAPISAPASTYANNDEFGDPTPANGSNPNDQLIRRAQYVLSYNQSRGTPNWVSYELDSRQMVTGQDRCNCFTADPRVPTDKQIFTSDYTNGGYDRGHMTRSADRTLANVDNAITFYLTNVVPQMADLNQGVWAQFENALADSARAGRAVYIITGPLYSSTRPLTFIKNEGKIAIPDSTWKVAFIGPRNGDNPFTRANVQSFDDLTGLTLLAVNMPNVSGVRNDPWSKYLTTVDKIEASTGYDFLSLLKTGFQAALDYHDHAPTAAFTTQGTGAENAPFTFDGTSSSDPDVGRTDLGRNESLTYSWRFSDGSTASGPTVTKTFAGHGNFTITLTATDAFGWPNTTTSTVNVAAPMAAIVRHAPTLNSGVDGSVAMLSAENVTLNSSGKITDKLFVPGTPTVRLNGTTTLGATIDGFGSASPTGYVVTLNSGAVLGTLARHTDPFAMPSVAAPLTSSGTRSVALNSPSTAVGDWATVLNLTVNGAIGAVSIPEGNYGDFTVNGSNKLVLGVAGATRPSVYNFQHLTVNSAAGIEVVGPVVVTVGNGMSLNGAFGGAGHPEWLTLQIAQGGLALNGVAVSGTVLAPNGTVTINSGSSLTGALAADRLTLNGGTLKITSAIP